MKEPEFPKEFLKHCPQVQDAKKMLEGYEPEIDKVALMYAECSFQRAGCGMACQSCKLFLRRPYLNHKLDEKFLPLIEKYYADCVEYDKYLETEKKNLQDCGSGI
jgi:hypothetical protein